jgi:4a-hydroxytetrahydrobiopterin dehydratase
MTTLRERRCEPCTGDTPRLDQAAIDGLLPEVPDWEVRGGRLRRLFVFRDFVHAMRFVDAMAVLAEAEQHHPDFAVHYREVEVSIWTHAVDGLSDNDFILAAKIDGLLEHGTDGR